MRLIDADELKRKYAGWYNIYGKNKSIRCVEIKEIDWMPTIDAVPLDKLCELLAEMYHCPGSGWPSSNHACHPYCPDEAFEKLCGTDCGNYTDVERWNVFLKHWMEEQNDG